MNSSELQQRLKKFSLRLVPLCEVLQVKKISKIIVDQLLRSDFSAAANYQAACTAQSKKTFNAKLNIALEEIDETCFRLKIIHESELVKVEKLTLLPDETRQPTKILGTSRRKP